MAAALLTVLATAGVAEAHAQVVTGVSRASLVLPVRFSVGPRLLLSSAGPAQVVGRTPAGVEIELSFRVASNIDWSISVGLPMGIDVHEGVSVQDEHGRWIQVGSGEHARVIARRNPSEPTVIRVRVRLPGSVPQGFSDRLKVSIGPAETGVAGQ